MRLILTLGLLFSLSRVHSQSDSINSIELNIQVFDFDTEMRLDEFKLSLLQEEIVTLDTLFSAGEASIVQVECGYTYMLIVEVENYLVHSDSFNPKNTESQKELKRQYFVKKKDFCPKAPSFEVDFSFNSSTLDSSALRIIDNVEKLMGEYPQIVLEIRSQQCPNEFENMSTHRILSVLNELSERGISKVQLMTKDYPSTLEIKESVNNQEKVESILDSGDSCKKRIVQMNVLRY